MCHRYPTLGRFEEDGTKRTYYVNDQLYLQSVHGKLECTTCHQDVDRIPHANADKVDCSTQCHLREPSTGRPFSHANMVDKYEQSVHGRLEPDGSTKAHAEDLPACLDCHDNRVLFVPSGLWGRNDALSNETLTRCKGCHTAGDWAEREYIHVTHRLRRPRDRSEVVRLCGKCHEDAEKMGRHGVESVDTYKETYHWQQIKYNVRDAPDCISCHVPVGYSAHDIRPAEDPISPLHRTNRVTTCANPGGVQSCHPNATDQFATGRVHAYGEKAKIAMRAEMFSSVDEEVDPLLLERAKGTYGPGELWRYEILALLKLAYKLLIGVVIGGMTLHQLLDFRRGLKPKAPEPQEQSRPGMFSRLSRNENNQHTILIVSFILLVVTGFALYLPERLLEQVALREMLFSIRLYAHRIAGVALILGSLYHVYYLALVPGGRDWLRDMLPRRKDATDVVQNMSYYLGMREHPPEFDRFSYQAKLEYYLLITGTTLMSLSGVVLWTETMWSKFVLDIALVVHGMEAVLACLALMVWHLYLVYLRPHDPHDGGDS
ncbi:MAG: cytochrome b/b6 domain-containing protein [Deltaproteobacteria bacterium]|nr:cytochrome b/b6 domain-containing protein [Deltaproteobacteria bacterium]